MTNWTFLGWYYQQGREQMGPVSSDEIARLVECGATRADPPVVDGTQGSTLHGEG